MIDWYSRIATRRLPPPPPGFHYRWSEGHWIENSFPSTVSVTVNTVEIDMFGNIANWNAGKTYTLLFTQEEMKEEYAIWEKKNGKCYQCEGAGQESYGHSKKDGVLLRPCKRCNSTGKPLLF